MPRTRIKWDRGAKKLQMAWDPKKMDAALKRHLRKASGVNGKLMEAEARQVIRTGRGLAKNAALTAALKGENKPLVGFTSEMFRAITSKVVGPDTVFVGVLRTDGAYNIAKIVHDGQNIPVTESMRWMFFYLWKASDGSIPPSKLTGRAAELWNQMPGGWKPLADSTTFIVIPSRPFLDIAFQSAKFKTRANDNWQMAVRAAIKERAKGQ